MVTSWPLAARACGSAAATSASPPVLANGCASDVTIEDREPICGGLRMGQRRRERPARPRERVLRRREGCRARPAPRTGSAFPAARARPVRTRPSSLQEAAARRSRLRRPADRHEPGCPDTGGFAARARLTGAFSAAGLAAREATALAAAGLFTAGARRAALAGAGPAGLAAVHRRRRAKAAAFSPLLPQLAAAPVR